MTISLRLLQLELDPLAKLAQAVSATAGPAFPPRHRNAGDHDTSVAHISKAAWDPGVTAESQRGIKSAPC